MDVENLVGIRESDALLLELVVSAQPAQQKWKQWQSITELQASRGATYDLLAALSIVVQEIDPTHPELEVLRGTYRKLWVHSQAELDTARQLSDALSGAGVRFLASPDQQLVEMMEDGTEFRLGTPRICVQYADSGRALRAVVDAGWSLTQDSRGPIRRMVTRSTWTVAKGGRTATLTTTYNPWFIDAPPNPRLSSVGVEQAPGLHGERADTNQLLLAMLTDGMEVEQGEESFRWAIGAMAVARSTDLVDISELVSTSLSDAILARVVQRIEVLLAIDPIDNLQMARAAILEARATLANRTTNKASRAVRIYSRAGRAKDALARFENVPGLVAYLKLSTK